MEERANHKEPLVPLLQSTANSRRVSSWRFLCIPHSRRRCPCISQKAHRAKQGSGCNLFQSRDCHLLYVNTASSIVGPWHDWPLSPAAIYMLNNKTNNNNNGNPAFALKLSFFPTDRGPGVCFSWSESLKMCRRGTKISVSNLSPWQWPGIERSALAPLHYLPASWDFTFWHNLSSTGMTNVFQVVSDGMTLIMILGHCCKINYLLWIIIISFLWLFKKKRLLLRNCTLF